MGTRSSEAPDVDLVQGEATALDLPADPQLAAAGLAFTLTGRGERRDLVAEIGCAVRMTYGDQLDRPIEKLGFYADLAERVLDGTRRGSAADRVDAWQEAAGRKLAHWQRTLTEMRGAGAADFATLTVGVESLRKLAE